MPVEIAKETITTVEKFLEALIDKWKESLNVQRRETTQEDQAQKENKVSQPQAAQFLSPAVEIKIGRETVYKVSEGQEPSVNRLTPQKVSALVAALRQPADEVGQANDSSRGRGSISIKVGGEEVFMQSNGVVHLNKVGSLDQSEQPQQIQSRSSLQSVAVIPPAAQTLTSAFSSPAAKAIAPQQIASLPSRSPKTQSTAPAQSAQRPLETVAAPATAVPEIKAAALAIADQRVQQIAPPQSPVRQFLSGVTERLQSFALDRQVAHRDQNLASAVVSAAAFSQTPESSLASGQSATNTREIANYQVSLSGNTYTVSSLKGEQLLSFQQSPFGAKLLDNNMSLQQQHDFLPVKDRGSLQGDVRAVQVAVAAKNILAGAGVDTFQSVNYTISQKDGNLTVTSNDGRGEVLSQQGGRLLSALTAKDVQAFQAFEQKFGVQSKVNQSTIENATKIVQALGQNSGYGTLVFEGASYRIEQMGNNLTIHANDSIRGKLLEVKDGKLSTSLLESKDAANFERVAQRLDQAQSLAKAGLALER